MTVAPRTTWTEDGHWMYHVHRGVIATDCHHCALAEHGRAMNRNDQALRDKAARERAEVRAAGLMLALMLAVVLFVGGLLLVLTEALPLNGTHLAGLGLMAGGSALMLRALWVARRRAER